MSTFFLNWFLSQVIWLCSLPIFECNYNFRGKYKVLMCSAEECHNLSKPNFSSLSSRHSGKESIPLWCDHAKCLSALYFRENNWLVDPTLVSPPWNSCLCSNSYLLFLATKCSKNSKAGSVLWLRLRDSLSALRKLSCNCTTVHNFSSQTPFPLLHRGQRHHALTALLASWLPSPFPHSCFLQQASCLPNLILASASWRTWTKTYGAEWKLISWMLELAHSLLVNIKGPILSAV